jgi:hypothetical protein
MLRRVASADGPTNSARRRSCDRPAGNVLHEPATAVPTRRGRREEQLTMRIDVQQVVCP